ncbi:uridine phosphorylase 1-like isoform X1 [Physella acuta]|uniref:uridine phosphorylase 1-like isoform X1 n=1 Tax=Physella acuta TaxID=109671 RepID=UPI0027DDD9F8|nr:uridine phosphorylase 1-like isoform X1 [Physella acuta]
MGTCDGQVRLPNSHLEKLEGDYLFHLNIDINNPKVLMSFRQVQFVCVGGTADRIKRLATALAAELDSTDDRDKLVDISNERYSGFKVGPILCVNHGIGNPSLSVMLHEVFKLLHKAKCHDVTLIRIGTCGGIGVKAGTVIVSTAALSAGLEPVYLTSSLGLPLKLPTDVDPELVQELIQDRAPEDTFDVIAGKTYCADDFYQGQGRLDGSFCDYTKEDQMRFLTLLYDSGVRNMDMESAGILAMGRKVGIKSAVVCVVIVDRLESELPTVSAAQLQEFQNFPNMLVKRFIMSRLRQTSKQAGNQ